MIIFLLNSVFLVAILCIFSLPKTIKIKNTIKNSLSSMRKLRENEEISLNFLGEPL